MPIPLQSVTAVLTSVAAGTTMTAMSEISVTQTPMFVSLSVWRTRSVWASTRSAMSSTTTASTVGLETVKHLSAAVQVLFISLFLGLRINHNYQAAMTVISTASIPSQSVWEITPVDVSQTQTAM